MLKLNEFLLQIFAHVPLQRVCEFCSQREQNYYLLYDAQFQILGIFVEERNYNIPVIYEQFC